MRLVSLLFVAVAFGVGCTRDTSQEATAVESISLQGVWPAKLDPSGADPKKPDAVQAVRTAVQFESMNDLEFPSEDRFAMCAGGYIVEGPVSREGNIVTLRPERLNGMTLEAAKSAGLVLQESLLRPMELKAEMNPARTRLVMPPGKYGEKLTYVRFDDSIATEMIDGPGAKFVGRWTVKELVGQTEAQRRQGFDYVLKRTKIDILGKQRYRMRFTYWFEGEWAYVDGRVILTYPTGKMTLMPGPGDTLRMSSPDGKMVLILAKT